MRNFFGKLMYGFSRFAAGRYGNDELSRDMTIFALVIYFLSLIPVLRFLSFVSLLLLILSLLRTFSKNYTARAKEREVYLKITKPVKKKLLMWKNIVRDRKTHRYYKCPNCRVVVRIRKPEKGRTITINCPGCHQGFSKKV